MCDGGADTRLVVRHEAGGGLMMPSPGMAMVEQNGAALLTVDGQCHYTAYTNGADVHTGTMTHDEASQLEEDLHVADWRSSPRVWDGLGCDQSPVDYRFEDVVIAQTEGCGSGHPSSLPTTEILQSSYTWMQRLVAESPSYAGSVRAIVFVPTPDELSQVNAVPAPWPLAQKPDTLALTPDQAIESLGTVMSPADSATLRSAMATAASTGFGTPFVATDGKVYLVVTRDVLPSEAPDGTLDLGLK